MAVNPWNFPVADRRGDPATLVGSVPETSGRAAFFIYPSASAVVLGSTQPSDSLDADALVREGLTVVRRRSGGGAVLVAPGEQVWLDLFVPTGDPLARDDVGRAAELVGEIWEAALRQLLGAAAPLAVVRGPLQSSRFSRRWCFAGRGPGEVTLGSQKVVGLSQRRDRSGAWFFTMALRSLAPERDAVLVAGDLDEHQALATELRDTVAAVALDPLQLEAALRSTLAG